MLRADEIGGHQLRGDFTNAPPDDGIDSNLLGSDLSKRVILDTRLLLNAAFVAGATRYATSVLRDLGYQPIVDDAMLAEGYEILGHYRRILGLRYDPAPTFAQYIERSGFVHGRRCNPHPTSSRRRSSPMNLATAARRYRAWVLTANRAVVRRLQHAHIPSRSPWNISAWPQSSTEVSGISPLRTSGFIGAILRPDFWVRDSATEQCAAVELENVGRIYYNVIWGGWVFESAAGVIARLRCAVSAGERWSVCGTYRFSRTGSCGVATLRVARSGAHYGSRTVRSRGSLCASRPGLLTIGRSLCGGDTWRGSIERVVAGPQYLDSEDWAAQLGQPDFRADPFAPEVLAVALSFADRYPSSVANLSARPHECELIEFANSWSS